MTAASTLLSLIVWHSTILSCGLPVACSFRIFPRDRSTSVGTTERRQVTRLLENGDLHVEIVPPSWRIGLLDISATGILVSGALPVVVGSKFRFRFYDSAGWSVTLAATAVYTHLRSLADRRPQMCVSGFMFADLTDHGVQSAIDELLNVAIGPVAFG